MANRKRSAVGALATIAILCALAVAPEARAASTVGTGTHPWVVVLCNFSDETATPFEGLFRRTVLRCRRREARGARLLARRLVRPAEHLGDDRYQLGNRQGPRNQRAADTG